MISLAPQGVPMMMPGATMPGATMMPRSPLPPAAFPTPGAVTPFKPAPRVNAGLAAGAPMPPPKVRAQNDDAPAAARLVMPSPEALGLGIAKAEPTAVGIDWNLTHQRLKDLGAVGFHLDRLNAGQV